MGSDWFQTTIGDQATLQRGFDITKAEQRPGRVPVVSSGGISSYHDSSTVKGPGVVLGRKGVIGSVYYIPEDFWAHDTSLWVRDFHGNNPRFVYYFFRSIAERLTGMDVGSANPTLNRNHVHPIQIPWTSREEQDEIVESLGSLDDKITLLQKTSVTIESIAHALFKSWFVDFDPVRAKAEGRDPEGVPLEFADLFPSEFENSSLGTIPKGWKVEHLGLHLEVLETGRRPKGGVGGIEEGIPSIGAESIFRVGQFDYSKTKFVSHEFFEGMRSGKLESRDVLLYKDGGKPGIFLPRVSMFGDGFPFDICGINEHVFRIRTRSTLSQSFLYFWLWSDIAMHELKHRGGKAAIPGINQSDVREVPVLVPSKAVLDEFSLIADALISRILSNAKEIRSLGELRDTLLPRIMSGKLRIPNVEEITA